jgi:uncharacterized protein with ParB-like and HNH nuclease domain
MKITPTQLSIAQLLGNKSEQFFIPAYQRRYAWTDKQLAELFEDINLLDKSDSHFMGNILLLPGPHGPGINKLEVVDGQQRIISLSLLLESIRDRFVELEKEDIVSEINGYMNCQDIERRNHCKVILGDLDQPDYQKVIALINENDQKDVSEIKNKRLLNAYIKLKKSISKFNYKDLYEYYYKLLNNTIVVRLDTAEAKDAYKLFETINNRGLSLRPTDIIKNFLLGHASLLGDKVLSEVSASWKDVIVYLDGIEADTFFRQYLMGIQHRKITYSKLIFEFKKYYLTTVEEAKILPEYVLYNDVDYNLSSQENDNFDDEETGQSLNDHDGEAESKTSHRKISIMKFAKNLKDAAKIYAKIINRDFDDEEINRRIHALQRIRSVPSYTFLLRLFEKKRDIEDIVSVLKDIESFTIRRQICDYRTAELDGIFSKLANIKGKDIKAFVKSSLAKHVPDDEEFEVKFFKHNFKKDGDSVKYILEEFEYDFTGNTLELLIRSGKDVHLEHIIPQTITTKKSFREFGDWIRYLGKDALSKHKEYVDRIGNYTLLAQKLNIKASNNPFKAKKKEYKKSNIRLTTKLADEYSRFKFKEVDERSDEFAKKAILIWRI